MAIISGSSLADANLGTGFAVTAASFIVDVDAGEVVIQTTRPTGDTVWKVLVMADGVTTQTITGPKSMIVDNPESGRLYRFQATNGGKATASASV